MSNNMNNQIVYIKTDQLSPHPCNPRKDLGDLTELAESIRLKGVMQNLTVVPLEREYRIVIGHRRAAAAKLAGVEEVPCIISNMSSHDQIETMLLENMQRTDLTVLEQANGFQMMLDFGESIESISRKTGFSESTVRRRVKLMEFDQKKLAKAVARGGSLMDFMELDKIEDPQNRNIVLDAIGTENFKSRLMAALDAERGKRILLNAEAVASTYARKIDKRDYVGEEPFAMEYVTSTATWDKENKIVRPEDADTVQYFYTIDNHYVTLYKENQNKAEPSEDIARREREKTAKATQKQMDSMARRHYDLRLDFVKNFKGEKNHIQEIVYFATVMFLADGNYHRRIVSGLIVEKFFGISIEASIEYSELYTLLRDSIIKDRPVYALLAVVYGAVDSEEKKFFGTHWDDGAWKPYHMMDLELVRVYELLEQLGYELSDEERSMKDGTHALFQKTTDSGGAEK